MTMKHLQILEREGKPAFAVLPIEEYEAMRDRLEDLEDLKTLRKAEAADTDAPGRPLEDVLKEQGLVDDSGAGSASSETETERTKKDLRPIQCTLPSRVNP